MEVARVLKEADVYCDCLDKDQIRVQVQSAGKICGRGLGRCFLLTATVVERMSAIAMRSKCRPLQCRMAVGLCRVSKVPRFVNIQWIGAL